jgi:hypothetical protein
MGAHLNSGRHHPPAIELHLSNGYFAVTEQRLDASLQELAIVEKQTLLWLIRGAGPTFARTDSTKSHSKGADSSRSGRAFRIGLEMPPAGATFDEFCEAVRTDPETNSWYEEKGVANGMRSSAAYGEGRAKQKPGVASSRMDFKSSTRRQGEPRPNSTTRCWRYGGRPYRRPFSYDECCALRS